MESSVAVLLPDSKGGREGGRVKGSQLLLGHVGGSEALASCSAFCKDLTLSLNSFIYV